MEGKRRTGTWLLVAVALVAVGAGGFFAGMAVSERYRPPAVKVQPVEQPALRVMSFNIRVNTESDGDNAWRHRRDLVARTIQFHQTDIAGLQESFSDMADDLVARLPDYGRIGDGDTLNPILYRESRLELLDSRIIWLSETPDVESVGWDASTLRTAAYALFREKRGGAELYVFNLHLDHRGEQSRENAAALIATKVGELPADARVIVLGDFNSMEGSVALEVIEDRTALRDAFHISLTGHHGPAGTFKGFKDSRYSGRRVDHIYVQNLVVQQHGFLTDNYDGRQPSDHYPVLAELVIEP